MKDFYIALLFITSGISIFQAQETIEAKVLDSINNNAIPYATVTLNNAYGVITNDQGAFLLNINREIKETDSLVLSCLGYEPKSLALLNFKDSIIQLNPKVFELNEISVNNKNYTVEEIIEKVKENLANNYDMDYTKSTLFFRQSEFTKVPTSKITIKKTSIPELNQGLMDSIVDAIPKKSDDYTEILGTMYGNITEEDAQKLDIIKASHLYDKNNEITFEAFEERLNHIIKTNVKKDSYFKIKSGIFGTKEEMDSTFFYDDASKETVELVEDQKKREQEEKENFLRYRRNTIAEVEQNSVIYEETDLNFLVKSNRYHFELLDYAFLNNNYVYKIAFEPKRKEDYKGIMYINPIDFALERIDYENVKPLKKFSLLGLSFSFDMHSGTLIYEQNINGKYMLKYAEMQHGYKMGVKRPLKIIEKNKHVKGRRKQNEIAGDIHFEIANITKKELVIFESESISESTFNDFKENAQVKPTYLPDYDPEFWTGYNVIEPNQAIKDFKSID